MLGGAGVKKATQVAILNANYVAKQLNEHYPVLYVGQERSRRPRVHSRHPPDQGRHRHRRNRHRQAPDGLRFPRADGVLSRWPARSWSSRPNRNRRPNWTASSRADQHPRRNPPDRERRLASRQQPAEERPAHPGGCHRCRLEAPVQPRAGRFPAALGGEANKFWPSVNRIDDVYGDRNLNCACPPMEAYAD
jgi:glycine dehydrogenase